MGFSQANLWRYGIFKNIKSLFSTSQRVVKVVRIPETGIISLASFDLATGYCTINTDEEKGTWAVIQKLKLRMEGCDELVLPISDRSYIPLDVLGRLTKEDKEKLVPLTSIADSKYDEAFSRVSEENKKNANARMLQTLIIVIGIIATVSLIIWFFKK